MVCNYYIRSDQAHYPYQAVGQQDMQTHAVISMQHVASLDNQVMYMLAWALL